MALELLLHVAAPTELRAEDVHVLVERLAQVGLRHGQPGVGRQLARDVRALGHDREAGGQRLGHGGLEADPDFVGVHRGQDGSWKKSFSDPAACRAGGLLEGLEKAGLLM